jgi:glycosyltransferase involved in cell wall biosynthesis
MKILFVVTAFYPEQAIGSVRVTKLAKYLHRHGAELTIISLTPPPWAVSDDSLYFPELKSINWVTIDQSAFFNKVFTKMRMATIGSKPASGIIKNSDSHQKLKIAVKERLQFLYTFLKAIDWAFQIRRYAKTKLKHQNFDAIFTSYPSLASPLSGLMLKKMGISNTLAVDFRDPISYHGGGSLSIRRRLELIFLQSANIFSFASEGVKEMVMHGVRVSSSCRFKYLTLNNGFDPEDQSSLDQDAITFESSSSFKIVYTGALYGGKRDVSDFFSALSMIIENTEFGVSDFEIHYAGLEGKFFLNVANQYGLSELVTDHGSISRVESLRLQKIADLCLLATWNTSSNQGILTGKIFEFFMLRKPILALVSGDLAHSEVKEVIERVGAGYCYEQAEPEKFQAMVDWLKICITEKFQLGEVSNNYQESVQDFNFEKLSVNLHNLFLSEIRTCSSVGL